MCSSVASVGVAKLIGFRSHRQTDRGSRSDDKVVVGTE